MRRIVLFDGECHFCDASVQFILARDQKATFQFAALQSE
ncbi:MAG TPA: DCC1-like thiol-disulfide oxidoreductase family protein, partial [Solibacillus sp.]